MLGGLFGVPKNEVTPQGAEVLRLTIGLRPINENFLPLGGNLSTLPILSQMVQLEALWRRVGNLLRRHSSHVLHCRCSQQVEKMFGLFQANPAGYAPTRCNWGFHPIQQSITNGFCKLNVGSPTPSQESYIGRAFEDSWTSLMKFEGIGNSRPIVLGFGYNLIILISWRSSQREYLHLSTGPWWKNSEIPIHPQKWKESSRGCWGSWNARGLDWREQRYM